MELRLALTSICASVIVDRRPVPPIDNGLHAQCVDNFISVATDPERASELANHAAETLRDRGLLVHEDVSGCSHALGWDFEGQRVTASRRRRWKLFLALHGSFQEGAASLRELARLTSQDTVMGLTCRAKAEVD